ncbi:hypothetical protein D3C84_1058050 [compost metagenome]
MRKERVVQDLYAQILEGPESLLPRSKRFKPVDEFLRPGMKWCRGILDALRGCAGIQEQGEVLLNLWTFG